MVDLCNSLYTKIVEHTDEGGEPFTDISDRTALAVWTMVACDMLKANTTPIVVQERLIRFLKENVSTQKSWESDLKPLLAAIERLAV